MYSGYRADGEWFQLYQIGFGGIPGRPFGDGPDGHSLWPSFSNVPNEFLEAYFPLRIESYQTVPDSGGPGFFRGGNGIDVVYRFLEPGVISIHDDRWFTYPWGVNGGEPGMRSRKWVERGDGSREMLPSKCDNVRVAAGDVLHYVTWGGGGWGDPYTRDPDLVALEVRRGLVSADGAAPVRRGAGRGRVGRPGRDREPAARAVRGARRDADLRPRAGHRRAARAVPGGDRAAGAAAAGVPHRGGAGVTGDLTAEYAAHGFSGQLGFGPAPAVVAVDIAMAYLDRSSPLYAGVEDAVASAARVIGAAREAGVPVLHTRVRYQPGGADGGVFRRKVPSLWVFDEDCPLGEPAPSVAPAPVVAVDIAMAYLDRSSPLYAGVEDAVASAARVIGAAREAGVPVLHTRVRYQPGGADGGVFRRKVPSLWVFDEGCPLGEPAPSVAPAPGEIVVVKQYASGFFGTSLASSLRSMGVDTVVVVGLTTSGCVRATTLDAMQHGFVPIVVRDAVGDRDPRPHEANLLDLQAKYADVVSEAQAVEGLTRPA